MRQVRAAAAGAVFLSVLLFARRAALDGGRLQRLDLIAHGAAAGEEARPLDRLARSLLDRREIDALDVSHHSKTLRIASRALSIPARSTSRCVTARILRESSAPMSTPSRRSSSARPGAS